MCGIALLIGLFVVTGAVLASVLGAVTGAHLVLSGPRDTAAVITLLAVAAYAVAGAAFWYVVGHIAGRPVGDWFRSGPPVASLKRDDMRTVRWLRLFAAVLRRDARAKRRAVQDVTGEDPGPLFPDPMADEVDAIRRHYEVGEYREANDLQRHLANWVARMGRGADYEDFYVPSEIPRLRAEGDRLMATWKAVWNIARDVTETERLLGENKGPPPP